MAVTSEILIEFRCPRCGSRFWSGHPQRSCKGTSSRDCRFTWNEADDYKYFRASLQYPPFKDAAELNSVCGVNRG